MAVKAKAEITLASVRDVKSTTRYYLLQSSTASKPARPSAAPPGGNWVKTEPAYTAGSTGSLYFTDLTVFSDDTYAYSDVSLSSSYEAAKAAYNKAAAAADTALGAQASIDAMLAASEIVVGTQTKATGAWTGAAGFPVLSDGQQIAYWLPYAGSGSATLKLTLSDGNTTAAIPVYYRGATRVTTHFVAGTLIHLTYRVDANVNGTSYTGWWADASYDSGNTYNRIRFENVIRAKEEIAASRFIAGDEDGYFPLAAGCVFDITKPILWASAKIAAGSTGSNNYLAMNSLTLRNNLAGATLTQYETCYLVGTLAGRSFTVKDQDFFTSEIPAAEDGFYYIALGYLYSTYQVYLYPEHPVYKFVNGAFMNLNQAAYEASVAAKEAQESVDSLEIGGRNLLLDSGDEREAVAPSGGSVFASSYLLSDDGKAFLADRERLFTLSAMYEVSGNEGADAYIYAQNSGSMITNCSGYTSTCTLNVNDRPAGVYRVTFRPTADQTAVSGKYIRFRLRYATEGSVLKLRKVKLELGNRATDWTPAPEDVEAGIQETADTVRTYAESVMEQKADEIQISISTVTGMLTTDIQDCRSQIAETEEEFAGSVDGLTTRVSEQEEELLAYKHEMSTYFRFNTDGLNIGKQEDGDASPYSINIDNEKMGFLQNGTEVAYVQYNKMYINAVEAMDRLSVGSAANGGYFDFISMEDGMALKWRAAEQPTAALLRAPARAAGKQAAVYEAVRDEEGVFNMRFGGEEG